MKPIELLKQFYRDNNGRFIIKIWETSKPYYIILTTTDPNRRKKEKEELYAIRKTDGASRYFSPTMDMEAYDSMKEISVEELLK